MKNLFLIIFSSIILQAYPQYRTSIIQQSPSIVRYKKSVSPSYTQRYNELLDRTEFYSNGYMTGYAKENTVLNQLEYFNSYGRIVKIVKHNDILDSEDIYDSYGKIGYIKYNDRLERYEVFDSYGLQIGYYRYNDLLQEWKYYKQ